MLGQGATQEPPSKWWTDAALLAELPGGVGTADQGAVTEQVACTLLRGAGPQRVE